MRLWARDKGKCVRQRTVRQETRKYKAGTLPLNMYQTAVHQGERLVLTVGDEGLLGDAEDEGHLEDVEDEGHLGDVEDEGCLGAIDNEGRDVVN